MPAAKVALKDQLFNRAGVARVAADIAAVEPGFPVDRFVDTVTGRFAELELKQRIAWISECLGTHLGGGYRHRLATLIASLPEPCDPTLGDGDFGDFIYAAYSDFVATHGCTVEHLDASLEALREITTRFSAEDAIRPFINAFPEHTLKVLSDWADDPHYHVRRLCSEGTRPRLPWSKRLTTPLDAAVPILDKLHTDRTRFVTRSVANHLNDIGKDDPDLVADMLDRWRATGLQAGREMDYIVRHSTRSLVKLGNERALRLIGVGPADDVAVAELACTAEVAIGGDLAFSFQVVAPRTRRGDLVVDYRISFPGPTGRIGQKIYKLRRLQPTADGQPLTVEHRHWLRADMTTRRIVAGAHQLDVLLNGRPVATVPFTVTDPL